MNLYLSYEKNFKKTGINKINLETELYFPDVTDSSDNGNPSAWHYEHWGNYQNQAPVC